MESYAGYKKTILTTCVNGNFRRVYVKDGKLYYRDKNFWHGTFIEYCF